MNTFSHERNIRKHIFSRLSLDHSSFTSLEWWRIGIKLWVKFMFLSTITYFILFSARWLCSLWGSSSYQESNEVHYITVVSKDKGSIAYFNIPLIIQLLETALVAKSKNYINPAFGHHFMLNNNRQIQLAATYEYMQPLLGKDWPQIQASKVRQSMRDSLRSSWPLMMLSNQWDCSIYTF